MHLVKNGCIGEAKVQRPLSDSELEEWAGSPRLFAVIGNMLKQSSVK